MSEERKIGENFDEKTAGDIFDKLRNVEGKIKPKQDGKFKNISDNHSEKTCKDNIYNNCNYK